MATRKGQLLAALKEGDKPEDLICLYQDNPGEVREWDEAKPIIRCTVDELPEREFSDGYGGTEGEPCIAFSPRYVYVCVQYDGAEHMEAVPRHANSATWIPWLGGG